jgi:hypothetical protein
MVTVTGLLESTFDSSLIWGIENAISEGGFKLSFLKYIILQGTPLVAFQESSSAWEWKAAFITSSNSFAEFLKKESLLLISIPRSIGVSLGVNPVVPRVINKIFLV